MKYYAEGIQKFERQLRLPVSNFSDDSSKQKEESGTAIDEL
jgi:hypothetical protein